MHERGTHQTSISANTTVVVATPEPAAAEEAPAPPAPEVTPEYAALQSYLVALPKAPQVETRPIETSLCSDCPKPNPRRDLGEEDCAYWIDRGVIQSSERPVVTIRDDNLVPGMVINANAPLSQFLAPVTTRLGPVALTSSLGRQANGAVVMASPSASSFRDALRELVGDEPALPTGTAPSSKLEITRVSSTEDLSHALGVSFDAPLLHFLGLGLKLEKRSTRMKRSERVLVRLDQAYYQVFAEPAAYAADRFAPGMTAEALHDAIDAEPLAYVSSITFGRSIYAVFESTDATSSSGLERAISLGFKALEVGFSDEDSSSSAFGTTSLRAIVNGDDYVVTDLDALMTAIRAPVDVRTAAPIAYGLRYVSDNSPFIPAAETEHIHRECQISCGSDPFEGQEARQTPYVLSKMTDSDTQQQSISGLSITHQDVDWYMFEGEDGWGGLVDPEATLSSTPYGLELCVYASCNRGQANPRCLSGYPAYSEEAGAPGCCSTTGNAHFDGQSTSLCGSDPDNATIFVKVAPTGRPPSECVGYTLTIHY